MMQKIIKVFYWVSPIIGFLCQTSVFVIISLFNIKNDPDSARALSLGFVILIDFNIVITLIFYIFLYAISRFRKHAVLLLGISALLFLFIWILTGFLLDTYSANLLHIILYFIWIMLYFIPIFFATKLYVLKN